MPELLDIEVDSYGVIANSGTGQAEWRALSLMSAPPAGGRHRAGRHHVYIEFSWTPGTAQGRAGTITEVNTTHTDVKAFCCKQDFADWYDILRNEAPVRFRCEYKDAQPGQVERNVNWVQLCSGSTEPPGEGSDTGKTNEAPAPRHPVPIGPV
jgi:hypothetical protein